MDTSINQTATRKSSRRKEIVISSDDESPDVNVVQSTKRGRKYKHVSYAESDQNEEYYERGNEEVSNTNNVIMKSNVSSNDDPHTNLGASPDEVDKVVANVAQKGQPKKNLGKGNKTTVKRNAKDLNKTQKKSEEDVAYNGIKDINGDDYQVNAGIATSQTHIAQKTSKVENKKLIKAKSTNSLVSATEQNLCKSKGTGNTVTKRALSLPNVAGEVDSAKDGARDGIVKDMQQQIYQQFLQFSQLIQDADSSGVEQIVEGMQKIINQFKDLSTILTNDILHHRFNQPKENNVGINVRTIPTDTTKRQKARKSAVNKGLKKPSAVEQKHSSIGEETDRTDADGQPMFDDDEEDRTMIPDLNSVLPLELQQALDKSSPKTKKERQPKKSTDILPAKIQKISSPQKYNKSKKAVVNGKGRMSKKDGNMEKPSTDIPNLSDIVPFQLVDAQNDVPNGKMDKKEKNKENNDPVATKGTVAGSKKGRKLKNNTEASMQDQLCVDSHSFEGMANNTRIPEPQVNSSPTHGDTESNVPVRSPDVIRKSVLEFQKDQRRSKRQSKKRFESMDVNNYDSDSSIEIVGVDIHDTDDEESTRKRKLKKKKKSGDGKNSKVKKMTARKSTGPSHRKNAHISSETSP